MLFLPRPCNEWKNRQRQDATCSPQQYIFLSKVGIHTTARVSWRRIVPVNQTRLDFEVP